MKPITFENLNPKAPLFEELKSGKYAWWEKVKNDLRLYIEIRKDNEVHVYYEGGRVLRLRYCSKKNEVQAFTHRKYLYGTGDGYENCAKQLDEKLDTIIGNVHLYSRKHGIADKEEWSEKFIQGNLIINHRSQYLDSEFAYNNGDIRIDLVECVNGELRFVELKRIDDARMVTKDGKPEIVDQIEGYRDFIAKHTDEILNYYSEIYALKKTLKLYIPDKKPYKVNPIPKLLVFNRWIKETPGRLAHREMMDSLYKAYNINYEIIMKIEEMKRTYYYQQIDCQLAYYNEYLKGIASNNGTFKGKPREFVLDKQDSCYNLYSSLITGTDNVLDYFNKHNIAWWGENQKSKLPSGHLVSSQVQCLNHLFALRKDKDAIKEIMRAVTKLDIDKILLSPLDEDGYITFEFVYKNISLLGERYETRGANCTSIDVFVYAQLTDKRKILIPIEWKYTETYNGKKATKKSLSRYPQRILPSSNLIGWYAWYNADPYYELMRQTLLVEQIIRHKGCGIEADDYFHIVVIPNEHTELKTAIEKNYVPTLKDSSKFRILDPKELLNPIVGNKEYADLIKYLQTRYWEK